MNDLHEVLEAIYSQIVFLEGKNNQLASRFKRFYRKAVLSDYLTVIQDIDSACSVHVRKQGDGPKNPY